MTPTAPSQSVFVRTHRRATWSDGAQRMRAMSRMSGFLATLRTEREVLTQVRDSLLLFFDHARQVEIYLIDSAHQSVQPVFNQDRGDSCLAALCASIDAIPATRRAAPIVPTLVPYLVVPNLTQGGGDHGPMMSAPLLHGTQLIGLLVVEAPPGGLDFTLADLDSLSGIAGQASTAVQSLRAKQHQTEGRRLQQDLELARRIQRSFLPVLAPSVNGFHVAAEYRPAYDVGGDFYDVVSSGPGQVTAVIGDVSGKGVAAALVMSRVSSDFRRLAATCSSPCEILAQLNASFASLALDDTFVTVACVRLDAPSARLTVANAGHVPPLLRRAQGGVQELGSHSGLPIGMLISEQYVDEEFAIGENDIVLLMTDGVVEPLNREEDPLGMQTLLGVIAGAPGDVFEINRQILCAVDKSPLGVRYDDVTLLGLKVGQDTTRMLAA